MDIDQKSLIIQKFVRKNMNSKIEIEWETGEFERI